MNGKTDIAMLFSIIEARLDPPSLTRCECGMPAVEVLCYHHPFILDRGVCLIHLATHLREHLLQ